MSIDYIILILTFYLDSTQASLFVLSCLIFIYLYFLLAKSPNTNFNLLVDDEEDYQVDDDYDYDDDDLYDDDDDDDDEDEEECQVEDDCNDGGDIDDDLEKGFT